MEKVAVIGGGQMGSQIAALSAMSGHETSTVSYTHLTQPTKA